MPEAAAPPPPLATLPAEIAGAVQRMLATGSGYLDGCAVVSPDWPHTKRQHHLEAVIALTGQARAALASFGGPAVDALVVEIQKMTDRRAAIAESFRQPVGKVPGRARGLAAYFAAVRAAAKTPLRFGFTEAPDVDTAIAIHDALADLVRSMDDVDRCAIAGKPMALRFVASPLTIRPPRSPHA